MKSFSSIIGALFVIGIIAQDLSNDETKKSFILDLMKNLCEEHDHHFIERFKDDFYNQLFDVFNNTLTLSTRNKNAISFAERLELVYNVMDREYVLEPHCLHLCINNETYIDCLKANIMITMLFHFLHNNITVYTGNDLKKKMIVKIVSHDFVNHEISDYLELEYNLTQMINHGRNATSTDTFNIRSPDIDLEKVTQSYNSTRTKKYTLLENAESIAQLVDDLKIEESSIRVDFLKDDRGARLERGASDEVLPPISSKVHDSSNVTDERKEVDAIPDRLDSGKILSNSEASSSVDTVTFKERDDSTVTDNFEITSISSELSSNVSRPVNMSIEGNSSAIEMVAEISNPSSKTSSHESLGVISSESTIIGKKEVDESSIKNELLNSSDSPLQPKNPNTTVVVSNGLENDSAKNLSLEVVNGKTVVKVEETWNNVSKPIFENETTSEDKKSKFDITQFNTVNTEGNHGKLKDVKVHDKGVKKADDTLCSLGLSCPEQKKTYVNKMDVSGSSTRLIFGIAAVLIVLGLAVGAVAISYFVLQKESPCQRRQRSSMNIDQPSQSRG